MVPRGFEKRMKVHRWSNFHCSSTRPRFQFLEKQSSPATMPLHMQHFLIVITRCNLIDSDGAWFLPEQDVESVKRIFVERLVCGITSAAVAEEACDGGTFGFRCGRLLVCMSQVCPEALVTFYT
jgi:hypothetical protein